MSPFTQSTVDAWPFAIAVAARATIELLVARRGRRTEVRRPAAPGAHATTEGQSIEYCASSPGRRRCFTSAGLQPCVLEGRERHLGVMSPSGFAPFRGLARLQLGELDHGARPAARRRPVLQRIEPTRASYDDGVRVRDKRAIDRAARASRRVRPPSVRCASRRPARHHSARLSAAARFASRPACDEVVHSRREAGLAVVAHRSCGHRDHARPDDPGQRSRIARRALRPSISASARPSARRRRRARARSASTPFAATSA